MNNQVLNNDEDWGFYVDFENINETLHVKNKTYKNKTNDLYLYDDACLNIYEYEYEDTDDDFYCFDTDKKQLNNTKVTNILIKVSSTTFITIALTYMIYVLL